MSAGFFVQGVAILFPQAPFDPELEAALAPLGASPRPGTAQNLHATSWVLPLRSDAGGAVLVDVLPRPWPDAFGDPETDASTFVARGAGAFGPGAWPGGLQRAARGSPEADALARVERHLGVVRVRLTYALDLPDGAPLFPGGRDPVAELRAVLEVAGAVLRLPGALAFYNPNAEVLVTPPAFERAMAASGRALPWPLVVAVRELPLEQPAGRLLDTLGLGAQFDRARFALLDHEILLGDGVDPEKARRMLQGLSATAIQRGQDWQEGDEVEGPGGSWVARRQEEALVVPPRPVWRWLPASQVGRIVE
jgi:hypothetical protein